MAKSRVPSPKETIKIRRLKVGDEVLIKARVTRVGRNRWDTADLATFKLNGIPTPISGDPQYVLGDDDA